MAYYGTTFTAGSRHAPLPEGEAANYAKLFHSSDDKSFQSGGGMVPVLSAEVRSRIQSQS